jgi:hypothetical protein
MSYRQGSHLAGINEERLAAPVAEAPILLVAGEEPKADGNVHSADGWEQLLLPEIERQ